MPKKKQSKTPNLDAVAKLMESFDDEIAVERAAKKDVSALEAAYAETLRVEKEKAARDAYYFASCMVAEIGRINIQGKKITVKYVFEHLREKAVSQ